MIDRFYFFCFRRGHKSMFWFSIMGAIAFHKSTLKHLKRGSPKWLVKEQIGGMAKCLLQAFNGM